MATGLANTRPHPIPEQTTTVPPPLPAPPATPPPRVATRPAHWRLLWRLWLRNARAGELTVLMLALILAVASMTSVAFLGDRLNQSLQLHARQLLGGDLLLRADHAWSEEVTRAISQHGLAFVQVMSFPSMVSSTAKPAAEGMSSLIQLADIKAVGAGYPLRGQLLIATSLKHAASRSEATHTLPDAGVVWLDERLAAALASDVGQTIRLGQRSFRIGAILTQEPDRGISMLSLAPRLMMRVEDVASTGLVRPGSRINHQLQLAGDTKQIAAFKEWLEPRLGRGEKLASLDDARPEMRVLFERAQRFLRLAALLTVILATVAVGYAAARYLRRHLDDCAIMRCLGASQAQLLFLHGGGFVLLALVASFLGSLLGYLVHLALLQLLDTLASQLAPRLPEASLTPWLQGLVIGLLLIIGFAYPSLLRLKKVSTLRVLRREWQHDSQHPLSLWLGYATGLATLLAFMMWIAGELLLGLWISVGFASALAIYLLAARLWLILLRKEAGLVVHRHELPSLRLALSNLLRTPLNSALQIMALALGLTALLLLSLASQDLLKSWQAHLPSDAPNRFVINIQPEQRAQIGDFFRQNQLAAPELDAMVRARLMAVNDNPINADSYTDERAQHLAEREFNLTDKSDLPVGNQITAGRWHGALATTPEHTEFSIEQGLAKTLGLQLGDTLYFEVAGQPLRGRITSLRELKWDSMRVNFFVITPPGVLDDLPTSDVTSFHLPAEKTAFINSLIRQFPNLTVIDVAALMHQLQTMLQQIISAIEVVMLLALFSGLVVLYAALQASQDQRYHEIALLKVLGARRQQLKRALFLEFLLLGLSAGALAGLGASLITWLLAHQVLQLDYLPDARILMTGLLAGGLGIAVAGRLATRRALHQHPLPLLRNSI